MDAGKDPRSDKQRDGGDKHADTGESDPKSAEGGVGTGTKTDPAKAPSAPGHQPVDPSKR